MNLGGMASMKTRLFIFYGKRLQDGTVIKVKNHNLEVKEP